MILKVDNKTLAQLAPYNQAKSVKATLKENSTMVKSSENLDLLMACENDWNNLGYLRRDRLRNIRYKNGNQWGDLVKDVDGAIKTESEILSSAGKVPLKHNFIQQFMRNIEGQKLTNPTDSIVHARSSDDSQLSEMLTNTLQYCHHLNKTTRLDTSILEELLLCGIGCSKSRYVFWGGKNRHDGRIDQVNTNRLFFNTDIEDPRMFDMRRVGEIHDYTFDELVGLFALNASDSDTLEEEYTGTLASWEALSGRDVTESNKPNSFRLPNDLNKCRVIEVWQRKSRWVTLAHDYADGTEEIVDLSMAEVEAINAERLVQGAALGLGGDQVALIYAQRKYEEYWCVKYLTPQGTCIRESETPYSHQEHPYTVATLPMVDGAIRGVMSDLIDIQRQINRLIVMIDFIMGSSAKGVLMIPQDCIPDGMTVQDFADEWVKANGTIVYKPNASGKIPEAISSNSTNIGAWEMLSLQMSNIQNIAGLSGAVQGQTARGNTPASLYAQEAQNSMINYVVVFEALQNYQQDRDEKLLKILMQYYNNKRHVDISGKAYSEVAMFYDPQMAQKIVDFNIVVTRSSNTPVFKQAMEGVLMDMLKGGLINVEMFLDNTTMPFAEKLKSSLNNFKESAAAGQGQDPGAQEALAAAQSETAAKVDPRAMELLGKFMG